MNTVHISKTPKIKKVVIQLPSSKSESNRILIINALAGGHSELSNLSEARDTQTMIRLLKEDDRTWDVGDAGTTMRFLTAYVAATGKDKILTGTARMQERPVKLLVEALRSLGAEITYQKNEGYPPIHIKGIKDQLTNKLSIRGDVSSQYISALLMVAPALPQGLELQLTGTINSRPYIDMTLELLKLFGIKAAQKDNVVSITRQQFIPSSYTVESDWSGASYWFSMASLAEEAEITLKGLKKNSFQGDSKIVGLMEKLGVKTSFIEGGLTLSKTPHADETAIDFATCPDLAQTIAVICAAKGIKCKMTGLQTLRIKETDRIAALQNELRKIGSDLEETVYDQEWNLIPSTDNSWTKSKVTFETYEDHRMAMAFAPLATLASIIIKEPEVVAKSYPRYWENLQEAGFILGH